MAEELITDIIDPPESILDEVLDETETSAYQP
ncbi:unnamed protein product, partial [Rotaria socialis]